MANFQGNRINPSRFSRGQIKFHIIACPLSIFMILPVIFMINNAFKPLGELFNSHQHCLYKIQHWITLRIY